MHAIALERNEVALVADQDLVDGRTLVLKDGLNPLVAICETRLRRHIECYDNAVCFLVKTIGHILVLLLPCRVPDFDLKRHSLDLCFVQNKVEAHRRDVSRRDRALVIGF